MKNKLGYRVLAGLLAVAMTAQCTALPVFAMNVSEETETAVVVSIEETQDVEETVEETEVVMVETSVDEEAVVASVEEEITLASEENESLSLKNGAVVLLDDTDVKQALYEALVASGSADPQSIEWEYKCKGKTAVGLEGNESWGSIDGFTTEVKVLFGSPTRYTHAALKDNKDGNYQIRIAGTTEEVTVTKAAKAIASIEVTGDTTFAMPYNEDGSVNFEALKETIIGLVGTTPEEIHDKLTVKYYANANGDITGKINAWANLEGEKIGISTYPAISTGNQKIQVSFAGNDTYGAASVEFDVTLEKLAEADIALTTTEFALSYNEELAVDYAELEDKILAAVDTGVAKEKLSVKYYAKAIGNITGLAKAWVNLAGEKIGISTYPAIGEGSQKIQITFAGDNTTAKTVKEFDVTIADRALAEIVLKDAETVKLPYNEDGSADYAALKENILALVDYETSTADIEGNLTVKYEAYTVADIANTGVGKKFANLEGEKINLVDYRPISEGTQKIKLTFAGNQNYKETSVEFTLTVVGRENVTVVEKETPDTVAMVFANDDLDYDYTAIEAAVWNAVVESTDPELTAEDVTVEYAANPLYKGATDSISLAAANFQSLDYKAAIGSLELKSFGEGEQYVRISFAGNTDYNAFSIIKKINVTEPERLESVVVLKEGFSIGYTNDTEAIKTAILNNMVDWEASTLPENVDMSRFVVEYWANPDTEQLPDDLMNLINGIGQGENIDKLLSGAAVWAPLEGGLVNGIKLFGKEFGLTYAQICAGSQQIRVSYKGNKDYKPSAAEGTIEITKASVKVNVHSTNIFADEKVPADFVTTNPVDKFDVYTVYAGITSDVTTSIFVTMPDRYTNSKVLAILDKALELVGQKTFTEIMQEGITFGELRNLLNTEAFLEALKFVGVDLGAMGQLLETISKLPAIGDNIRIAFNTPDQAGLYTVAAITDNKNYNTGVGVGFLLVKMRTSGVKLVWNSDSNKFTAEEVANGADLGATLTYNGEAVKNQGSVKYLYTGIQSNWKPYSSTKAPTEPGSYIVTATVIGGNYMALPATRTFKITK